MTSNNYISSPSPYTNSPIRVPHSRQNTMSSLFHVPGTSSPLKTSTAASSIYTLPDSVFEAPGQVIAAMPNPPPRAHRAPTTSSISSSHSYDSKQAILQRPQHEPPRLHNLAAKLLGSPNQAPKNTKLIEAENYAAALLSSQQSYHKFELERKRDEEKRRERNYASSFSTLLPRPPKVSKFPNWLPLSVANSGLLSLFVVLVVVLSRDRVSMRTSEIIWLILSVVAMFAGGSWWIGRKLCPKARAARQERDEREMRSNLSRNCSYSQAGVENGSRFREFGNGSESGENGNGIERLRSFRYQDIRPAGPAHKGRVYSNSDGGAAVEAVRYGSLESLNRVGPAGAGRMRSQTHPFERIDSQGEEAGNWRQELAKRQERPFVKSERGSIFREEFEMGGWKGGRGEEPLIGVAM